MIVVSGVRNGPPLSNTHIATTLGFQLNIHLASASLSFEHHRGWFVGVAHGWYGLLWQLQGRKENLQGSLAGTCSWQLLASFWLLPGCHEKLTGSCQQAPANGSCLVASGPKVNDCGFGHYLG